MNRPILIRGARQLVTLRGPTAPRRGAALNELGIIPNGAILIRDGRIAEVGQGRRVENLALARDAIEIDAAGRVILPGFVDSHTHLVGGPPRLDDFEMRIAGQDSSQIAEAGRGVLSSVKALRAAPSRTLESHARLCSEQFVRHGSTTLEAKTGYGLDHTGELKVLRVLAKLKRSPLDVVPTYLGAYAVPPEYEGRAREYIDWIIAEMLPMIRRRKLARFVDVNCERDAFRLDDSRRCLEAARALGFALKIHAERLSHSGGARLAVELGAVSADHLEHASPDDIAILAQSSTIATLLPGAVFHAGSTRYAPARSLIDSGAAVALATDFNTGVSPTCNMPMILSLACACMRMTPAEAISAATINGACALGCADRAGSIETGKDADLVMFDASDYREIPYRFGVNLVAMTMKRGVVLYQRGEVSCPAKL
jgi:imidazolonepropionase